MVAPSVGDWLDGRHGTIDNSLWPQGFGLHGRAGWKWEWLRDGTPIAEATHYRYQVQAADVGAVLVVRVTPLDLMERFTNTVESDPTDPVT